MKYFQLIALCTAVATITACSSGSSSDPATDSLTETEIGAAGGGDPAAEQDNPVGDTLTGRFLDGSVAGLTYETATQSGLTGSDGSFNYLANESVTFSLGDIVLPAVTGADIITPLDIFSSQSIEDVRVQNLLRLLQTLDVDANPDNGIVLSDAATLNATGLNVDFSSPSFDSQVVNLVANSGSSNSSLIDTESALEHFMSTLIAEGVVLQTQSAEPNVTAGSDTETQAESPTGASGNDSTHPLVGRSAEFAVSSIYGISGTLTVLDNRTLQVTNFNYTGAGPSVFFYTGRDGNYSPRDGGQLIGPQLNGTRWEGDTITLDLPDGLTLDDFDGLSVWCDIFFINFSDAVFQ